MGSQEIRGIVAPKKGCLDGQMECYYKLGEHSTTGGLPVKKPRLLCYSSLKAIQVGDFQLPPVGANYIDPVFASCFSSQEARVVYVFFPSLFLHSQQPCDVS